MLGFAMSNSDAGLTQTVLVLACPILRSGGNVTGLAPIDFPYIYRWDREGRKGQPCRLLARGKMNSILVEFADGHQGDLHKRGEENRTIKRPNPPAGGCCRPTVTRARHRLRRVGTLDDPLTRDGGLKPGQGRRDPARPPAAGGYRRG